MPFRRSIPRIRVESLDGSPRTLPSSSTLDIRDILDQVKRWPKLSAEEFAFDGADDALYLEDGCSQEVPPFPVKRRPKLFFLNSHGARRLLPTHRLAFERGELCRDEEDTCPLVTAPTIPRMKLIMKEQLYMRKWVDALSSDDPPNHIPWSCEMPAAKRTSIVERPARASDMVDSSTERRKTVREHPRVADTIPSVITDHMHSSTCASTQTHASTSQAPNHSANIDSGTFRKELTLTHMPHRPMGTAQVSSPPTLFSPGLKIGTVPTTPDAPLAVRRGKSLSGLTLKEHVIEQLEYPDIPTAFRGSLSVWSPRFDSTPTPFFTDHQSMMLSLRTKCTALGNGIPTYVQELSSQQGAAFPTSSSSDEWAFARGLATFDNYSGWTDGQVPKEIVSDLSIFLPKISSTSAKVAFTARSPRLDSAPPPSSPVTPTGGPPGLPLPPRPAIVSPLTSPHVRGILKKAKSVRFEDMVTKEPQDAIVSPPQPLSESALSPPLAVMSGRPCTPTPNAAKPSSGLTSVKEVPTLCESTQEKKFIPSSRLPPKRIKVTANIERKHPGVGRPSETSKSTSITTQVERPCRDLYRKENQKSVAAPQGQTKHLSIVETDVRKSIESSARNRLSTPLRNIFRFR